MTSRPDYKNLPKDVPSADQFDTTTRGDKNTSANLKYSGKTPAIAQFPQVSGRNFAQRLAKIPAACFMQP